MMILVGSLALGVLTGGVIQFLIAQIKGSRTDEVKKLLGRRKGQLENIR